MTSGLVAATPPPAKYLPHFPSRIAARSLGVVTSAAIRCASAASSSALLRTPATTPAGASAWLAEAPAAASSLATRSRMWSLPFLNTIWHVVWKSVRRLRTCSSTCREGSAHRKLL